MQDFQRDLYLYHSEKEMSRLTKNNNSNGGKGGKGGTANTLKAMTTLKKIVNHPALLDESSIGIERPPGFKTKDCASLFSGKMLILERMLEQIK